MMLLRDMYQNDPAAKLIFDWAAGRKQDAVITNLNRVWALDDSDIIDVAKRLQYIGCGVSHGPTMRWSYSLKSMAHVAQGHSDTLEEVDPELAEDLADADANRKTTRNTITLPEAMKRLGVT